MEKESQSNRFRILSLDGGGIRGVFAAAVLAETERSLKKRIVDHFDLIVGTSTGGIIALAVALGIAAERILDFYETKGPIIFPSTGFLMPRLRALRQLVASKHRPDRLREALAEVLGDRVIGEAVTRLAIVSYDAVRGDVHLFKTAHSPRFNRDFRTLAVEAALATSAAPTYLPDFRRSDGVRFIDGGVWANCPATVGILEAIAVLGRRPQEIDVLSIGTTAVPFDVSRKRGAGGILSWHRYLLELLTQAQVKGALAQANLLTDHVRLLRIDETVRRGRFSLDAATPDQIEDLKALGIQRARHEGPEIMRRFFEAPVVPFEPAYKLEGGSRS